MLYDLRITPEQLKAAAAWTEEGMNEVELVIDGRVLLAAQGDERMAWDERGKPESAGYLARAPLDPLPFPFPAPSEREAKALRAVLAEVARRGYDDLTLGPLGGYYERLEQAWDRLKSVEAS